MLEIDNKLLSLDLIEKKFCCDISVCKGACCIQGDSGAPLEDHEAEILDEIYPIIKSYLRKEGIDAIEKQGLHIIDNDGDVVTPLIDDNECAFVIFEDDVAKCAIERAYFDGKVEFRKPVSCHLYPIRIKKYKEFDGVNYDKWAICKPAVKYGNEKNIRVFEFAKEALIRKYGEEWYEKLKYAGDNLKIEK